MYIPPFTKYTYPCKTVYTIAYIKSRCDFYMEIRVFLTWDNVCYMELTCVFVCFAWVYVRVPFANPSTFIAISRVAWTSVVFYMCMRMRWVCHCTLHGHAYFLHGHVYVQTVQIDHPRVRTLTRNELNWNIPIGTFQLKHTVSQYAFPCKTYQYTH